jgi:pimeloyl-ACP methyl ester carboxylesterase
VSCPASATPDDLFRAPIRIRGDGSRALEIPEPDSVFDVPVAGGATITVRRHGNPEGPRLVLSHGSGFSIDSYYPFWSLFTDRFDLFIHDFRNHGWNPVTDRRMHNPSVFVGDSENVIRDIDRRFGEKPKIGVFHSLSALTVLVHATHGNAFSALVLFDLPICPTGGFPQDLQGVGRRLGAVARRRQDRFETPEQFAEHLSRTKVFGHLRPNVLNLLASTTLRRVADGTSYELRCPREYEAQICEYMFCWAMTVDLETVTCPIKAIGSDPTVPYSYMPSIDIADLDRVDYDFVPGTTHLLPIEQPETCAALTLEFLADRGLASVRQ